MLWFEAACSISKNGYFQVAMSLLYAHYHIFIIIFISNSLVKFYIMRKYVKKFEYTDIIFAQFKTLILPTFQVIGWGC